jgi:hypothetical protein
MTSRTSPPPDLRRLAEAAAAANGTAKIVLCELLLIGLNVAALTGALVCRRSGSEWTGFAVFLVAVEIISLLPLLVGVHWAAVARVSHRVPLRR